MSEAALESLRNDLNIVGSFHHKSDQAILSIITANDGTAWIGSADNSLQRVDQSGTVLQSLTLNHPAVFSSITEEGDLIVSHGLSQHTKLTRITPEGDKSDFYDLAPCEAIYDVKVTSENEVLVCKETSFFDNIGKLVRISMDGVKNLEVGRDVLKNCPTRVTEMPDGNYCTKVKDRLLFVTPEGKLIRQTEPSNELSNVCTIVCDQFGFIIGGTVISDTDRQFIYLFNDHGQCLRKYSLPDSARLYVTTIDNSGVFWIGKDNGQVTLAKYIK